MNYKKFIEDRDLNNQSGLASYCNEHRRTVSYRLSEGYTDITELPGLVVFNNPETGKKLYSEVSK
jgi:hypothetical protein